MNATVEQTSTPNIGNSLSTTHLKHMLRFSNGKFYKMSEHFKVGSECWMHITITWVAEVNTNASAPPSEIRI